MRGSFHAFLSACPISGQSERFTVFLIPAETSVFNNGYETALTTVDMHASTFFLAFLKNWREVGWPLQTSHHSARRICNAIDFCEARCVVEVGAGSGNVTREILKSLRPDAQLIVFEINGELCKCLEAIDDRRLVVYNESGFDMGRLLKEKVDYVISEIPIATLSETSLDNYYQAIKSVLHDRGSCIQLQLSPISYPRLKRLFKTVKVAFTLLNSPPLFIYSCRD